MPTCIAAGRHFLANNNKEDDSFSDSEHSPDNDHEDGDDAHQGDRHENNNPCLHPHSVTLYLPVEFLVDAVAFFIFFVHDSC